VSVREAINKNPGIVTGVTVGVIVIVLVLIFWPQRGPKSARTPPKAYYTVDDGQTTFEDDLDKVTPFDHDGGKAVRAHVFSCNGGRTRFVGFLEKMADKAGTPAGGGTDAGRARRIAALLVKPPKNPNAKWVAQSSPEGSAITSGIQCPEKSDALPNEVLP
jgi:hypothetical protein